jgi:hypothetical protein
VAVKLIQQRIRVRERNRSVMPGVRSTNPVAWSWMIRACFAAAAPIGIHGESL